MIQESIPNEQDSLQSQQLIEQRIVEVTGIIHKKVYQKIKYISQHSTGKYYEIREVNEKRMYRTKVVYKSQLKTKDKNRLLQQIANQQKFQHPNFVKLQNVFQDNNCVYLLTEVFQNGSLQDLLRRRGRLSEQEVAFYFKNFIEVLTQLKKKKIIHRDIRLENIQIGNQMMIKLGDFGLSCSFEGERRKSILKLNHYSSPQIINQVGHGFQTDLWSVGVIIYRMLVGRQPFKVGDTFSLTKIQNSNVFFPEDIAITDFWKNVLKKILISDQNDRITLNQLAGLLICETPSSLPNYLLNVRNRLPSYFQTKKNKINNTFLTLHKVNFKNKQSQITKGNISNKKLVRSEIIKSIALQLSMNSSKIIKKVNFAVVEDWIISTDTISYLIGCFVCVNFKDKTKVYNSFNTVYLQNSEGLSSEISEQEMCQNKILARKHRFHKSMSQSFAITQEDLLDAGCPFFVQKVYIEDKYLIFHLTNGNLQLCFNNQPKQCYLVLGKGKIQFYNQGKESDGATRKFTDVQKIIKNFKKLSRQ